MVSDDNRSRETGLLRFAADQQSFEIGGIRIGGTPGIRPAVLIGSMFYHGHVVNVDEDKGEIDRDASAALIRMQDDYAKRTGNPGMLDVVGATPEALELHLEFAAGITEMPLLIDGTTVDVRMAGLDYVAKAGLAHRAVYNSIQPGIGDDELEAIGRAGVEAAIILTYYLQDFTAAGRVHAVEELLPRMKAAGVCKPLVDTCVLDLATMGQALEAMVEVKSQFGLPAGGGVHNAVAMWRGLKSKMGKQAYVPCMASAAAMAVGVGADFVLYGPIEDAPSVFPAVAMADTALSQIAIERGQRPEKDHPRFRVG